MMDTFSPVDSRRSRRIAPFVTVLCAGALVGAHQGGSPLPPLSPAAVEALKDDLVVANRMLFEGGFLDTQGHVSVRLDANRYLMAWRLAPEHVVAADILEYNLDGATTDSKKRPPYLERFIHGEIYRARPDVRAIVHGHTPSLVMFSSSNITLRPVIAGARFIGAGVPAFQNGDTGGGVNNAELGRGLAAALGHNGAVLMRGHGVVVTAPDLIALVLRSLSLDRNAQMVSQLIAMNDTPIYLRGDRDGAAPPAPTRGPGGDDDNREWAAWKRRTAALLGRK